MNPLVRSAVLVAALAAIASTAGCQSTPTGPSLANVVIQNVALQATTADATVCCCRVVGTATNNNAVGVHITIKFKAYDGRFADPMSTVVYFIKDFQPKAVHTISAAGLLFPCSSVASVKYEVDVKGLDSPPE